ncbi:hypothetical protein [Serratia ficaria]|uniref:hypothetical protein n=1 Tax=Serratia ficaria TaxID=61651 RepID=UPI000AAEBC2A|nr:Uncharacterised protein [Serratia ficaria]
MAKEKGTRILLLIGAAWLMVGCERQHQPVAEKTPAPDAAGRGPEIKRQLDLNDALPEIGGTLLFREAFLDQPQTQQAVQYLKARWRG